MQPNCDTIVPVTCQTTFTADVTTDLERTKELKATLQAEHDKLDEKLTLTEKKLHSESACRSQYEKTLRNLARSIVEVLPKTIKSEAED